MEIKSTIDAFISVGTSIDEFNDVEAILNGLIE